MAIEDRQSETLDKYESVKHLLNGQQIAQVDILVDEFAQVYENEDSTVDDCDQVLDDINDILSNI
jgi:hypothetical protein